MAAKQSGKDPRAGTNDLLRRVEELSARLKETEEALRKSLDTLGRRVREQADGLPQPGGGEPRGGDAGERARLEDAIAREKDLREAIERSILFGLMATDLAGRITRVNDTLCTMTGWSRKELLGTVPPFPFWPPEEIETLRTVFQAIMEGRIPPGGIEVRYMRRDGERFDALLNASPLKDARGAVRGYVRTIYDITYRKRMETELVRSEERFRTSIETLLDGFALLAAVRDPLGGIVDFRIAYANEAGCRTIGMSREDLIGRTLLEIYPVLRQTDLFDSYRRVLETGEPLVKRSLSYRDVPDARFLDRTFDHRVAKLGDGLAMSWREVTDRVAAEGRRAAADRALGLLRAAAGALVRAGGAAELFRDVCAAVVEAGDHRLAWAGLLADDEPGTIRPVAVWGYGGGFLDTAETAWSGPEPGQSPAGKAVRTGSIQIVPDIAADPDLAAWREEAASHGLASCIALPLTRGDRILGALAVYSGRPNAFGAEEARLLADLAGLLAFGAAVFRARASGRADLPMPKLIPIR